MQTNDKTIVCTQKTAGKLSIYHLVPPPHFACHPTTVWLYIACDQVSLAPFPHFIARAQKHASVHFPYPLCHSHPKRIPKRSERQPKGKKKMMLKRINIAFFTFCIEEKCKIKTAKVGASTIYYVIVVV